MPKKIPKGRNWKKVDRRIQIERGDRLLHRLKYGYGPSREPLPASWSRSVELEKGGITLIAKTITLHDGWSIKGPY